MSFMNFGNLTPVESAILAEFSLLYPSTQKNSNSLLLQFEPQTLLSTMIIPGSEGPRLPSSVYLSPVYPPWYTNTGPA